MSDEEYPKAPAGKKSYMPVYLGILVLIVGAIALAFSVIPKNQMIKGEQSYICTKKIDKRTNKNITLIERGRFTKKCIIQNKGKPKRLKGDCGKRLTRWIKKGYNCKKTGLNLN